MARLPALVDAIAQEDGRGRPAIAHVARRLRDAGLIFSPKRGAGGAIMTAADAATLLVGAYADLTNPHEAPQAVRLMKTVQPLPDDDFDRQKRAELPVELRFLKKRMSFMDTVEQLIAHAGSLRSWQDANRVALSLTEEPLGADAAEFGLLHAARKFARAGAPNLPANAQPIRVICYTPGYAAEVHIGYEWNQLEPTSPFHACYIAPLAVRETIPQARFPAAFPPTFGLPVLLSLSRALQAD